ncbi:hypothetical protein ACET98_23840 [Aeromonas veronii]
MKLEQIKFYFDREYMVDFDIPKCTKNKDHLTVSELCDLLEQITVSAKKNLKVDFVLMKNLTANFYKKTKPDCSFLAKYKISHNSMEVSILQNEEITAVFNANIHIVT